MLRTSLTLDLLLSPFLAVLLPFVCKRILFESHRAARFWSTYSTEKLSPLIRTSTNLKLSVSGPSKSNQFGRSRLSNETVVDLRNCSHPANFASANLQAGDFLPLLTAQGSCLTPVSRFSLCQRASTSETIPPLHSLNDVVGSSCYMKTDTDVPWFQEARKQLNRGTLRCQPPGTLYKHCSKLNYTTWQLELGSHLE